LGRFEALEPPLDERGLLGVVPELSLSRGIEQGPYHHLDTFEHTLEVVRGVERELEESRLGARVRRERVEGLRLAALHDVAKPVTRGEVEGRVLFISHDSLGAGLVRTICRRLGLSASLTDLAATLTALHLKIGFMKENAPTTPDQALASQPRPRSLPRTGLRRLRGKAAAQQDVRGPRLRREPPPAPRRPQYGGEDHALALSAPVLRQS
jgi:poly(A) polymerase